MRWWNKFLLIEGIIASNSVFENGSCFRIPFFFAVQKKQLCICNNFIADENKFIFFIFWRNET